MGSDQTNGVLREVAPDVWRGRLGEYHLLVFRTDGRWVGQAFTGSYGVNQWADSLDDASARLCAWVEDHGAMPDKS